jgi:uncharacterized protein YcbX
VSGTVVRLSIAPVKALGLVHPDSVELEANGAVGDRRFWLVDETGRLYNNKRCGPLVQIRADWSPETEELALVFPGGRRVTGLAVPGAPIELQMYGEPRPSRIVDGPWAEALSGYTGEPLRLVSADATASDRAPEGGTVSLVSHASLERLAREAGADSPLDGRRFRMLFEIDGVAAHEEDSWLGRDVEIGSAVIRINGDVGRCVVTSHDPGTGITDVDTLGALARYRKEGVVERLPFGVYGSVVRPGRATVGDPVRPLVS